MAIVIAQALAHVTMNLVPNARDVTQNAIVREQAFAALNSAVEEWFSTAAPVFTVNDISKEFFPPVQVTINVTQDSMAFTYATGIPAAGYANSSATVGQAIIINGDGQILNRVEQDGVLWRAYLGATGTVAATLYADTAAMLNTQFSLVGPVMWTGVGQTYPIPLEEWGAINPWLISYIPEWPITGYLGQPWAYVTANHQPTSGVGSPYWYLRMWPLPSSRGNASFQVRSQPTIYSIADLSTQRTIPIPDQYLPLLGQLAQEGMMTSPFWNKDSDKQAAIRNVATVRARLHGVLATRTLSTSPNQCGTPRGF